MVRGLFLSLALIGVPAATAAGEDVALTRSLAPEERAEVAFLEHLGWRFVRDGAVQRVTIVEGSPGWREDVASAQAAGDLVVRLPVATGDEQVKAFRAVLPGIADGRGSRCAYLLRLGPAVKAATKKLADVQERGCYSFPSIFMLQMIHSPWFTFRGPEPEWAASGQIATPTGSPAAAIEALYQRGGVAECFGAQLLAVYATQYELYGAAAYDRVFRPEDLPVGVPGEVEKTGLGQSMRFDVDYAWEALLIRPATEKEDPGVLLGRLGPRAFAGLTGIVMDQTQDARANQNVIIVSVSPKAAQALRDKGGMGYVVERAKAASEKIRAISTYASPAVRKTVRAEVDQIMADPVFTEITVYVHPMGVLPLGKVMRDEMEKYSHPVYLYLYLFGRDDHYYQVYRRSWKDDWLHRNGIAAPKGP